MLNHTRSTDLSFWCLFPPPGARGTGVSPPWRNMEWGLFLRDNFFLGGGIHGIETRGASALNYILSHLLKIYLFLRQGL